MIKNKQKKIERGDLFLYRGEKVVILDVERIKVYNKRGNFHYRDWVVYSNRFADINEALKPTFFKYLDEFKGCRLGHSKKSAAEIDRYIMSIAHRPCQTNK